jgi:hypothetical protein
MAATQTLAETIDQLNVGAVGLVKNDQPDVDEEDSADEGQDLVDTNTSTKKKKKKKPKKKVSSLSWWICPHELTSQRAAVNPLLGSVPPEIPPPAPETEEERSKWESILGPDAPLYEPPVVGLVEERVSLSKSMMHVTEGNRIDQWSTYS